MSLYNHTVLLSCSYEGDSLIARLTFKNTLATPIFLERRRLGQLRNDFVNVFFIMVEGRRARCNFPEMKRVAPTEADFLRLNPNSEASFRIDLSEMYPQATRKTKMSIQYGSSMIYPKSTDVHKFVSNIVKIE